MKKKVFFVHPSALDDGSQDASANPALQMVENEVKRNKKGEPKFYVLLSPKKADNPFSQFHPDRLQILDQAYRLGLTPKKYTLFEPVHPTEPKESFIECSSALLLQFVNGGDLLNFLCDHLELSFDQKLDLALQALRLVIQLHDNQIAHLDLKPENFLVYIREVDTNSSWPILGSQKTLKMAIILPLIGAIAPAICPQNLLKATGSKKNGESIINFCLLMEPLFLFLSSTSGA